jgi:CRISPR-associated exonuclease Cas4
MVFFAVLLIFLAILVFWQTSRRQKSIGLPSGRVIYADTRLWGALEQPLYDADLGLTGKPDYLVEEKGQVIPVEVKSSQVTAAPYDAHIFQLAAYCLLVQRHYGKRPPYGILHYPNRTFAIDYTAQLEAALLELLDEMRQKERVKELARSHEAPARCARCGFRSVCDQKLTG